MDNKNEDGGISLKSKKKYPKIIKNAQSVKSDMALNDKTAKVTVPEPAKENPEQVIDKNSIVEMIKTDDKTVDFNEKEAAGTDTPDIKDKKDPEKNKKVKRIIKYSLLGLLALLIVGLAVFGVGIYRFKWNTPFTRQVVKTIPYPAALVNWKAVSYSSYIEDVQTLKHFYQKQSELTPGTPAIADDQIKQDVMKRLINDELVYQLDAKKKLKVTADEVNTEFKTIVDQAGSEASVETTLNDLYGWTSQQFKDKVLLPFLYRKKLQISIQDDPSYDGTTKAKAEEVLAQVTAGDKTFEELAKQYSTDTTAAQGGDLGAVSKGETVLEFENALFALKPGEVSGLVKTQYGYHIIKAGELIPAKDANSQDAVNAKHILIALPTLDSWLETQLKTAKVIHLVKI